MPVECDLPACLVESQVAESNLADALKRCVKPLI
jgi:hypothetical protein